MLLGFSVIGGDRRLRGFAEISGQPLGLSLNNCPNDKLGGLSKALTVLGITRPVDFYGVLFIR